MTQLLTPAHDIGFDWSCAELAERLRVKPREIQLMAERGELPCVWWGTRPVFEEAEIERWLEDHSYHPQSRVQVDELPVPMVSVVPVVPNAPVPYQRADGRWSVRLACPDGRERRFISRGRERVQAEFRRQGRPALSRHTRWTVLERDRFTCRYCGRSAPDVELELDHVVSVMDGGTDEASNLAVACVDCNLGKGRRSITGWGEV